MAAKRGRENDNTKTPGVPEPELEDAFDRLVDEGEVRLKRSTLALLTTGILGGLDVGIGVLAYLVVEHLTHNVLLAGLGFSLGFVALLLGRSELFTENRMLLTGAAFYEDAYRRCDDGRWRISRTGYQRVYEAVQSLDDVPSWKLTANRWA